MSDSRTYRIGIIKPKNVAEMIETGELIPVEDKYFDLYESDVFVDCDIIRDAYRGGDVGEAWIKVATTALVQLGRIADSLRRTEESTSEIMFVARKWDAGRRQG